MRNKRLLIALAGAVVFGLLATMMVTRYLSNAQAYTRSLGNVVVAKFAIPLGTKITAELLTTTPIPQGSMPEGAFNSMEKVVGRIAITNIGVREPITDSKLAMEGAAGGLQAVIPEGYRAMTVKVDDVVGISGFLQPGSFVDVVAVIQPPNQSSSQDPISKIVLQNIKVLANGSNIDQPKDGREATTVKTVTLQVTPEQAEKLALAVNEGKLQLVMRNYGDQSDSSTNGVNKRTLLTGDPVTLPPASAPARTEQTKPEQPTAPPVSRPRAAAPRVPREQRPVATTTAPPAPSRPSVELIQGAKKSNVDFP
ncbi:MAG: Flp pilus assembly protein CpaB [Pyrinomonadaceae bacterium]